MDRVLVINSDYTFLGVSCWQDAISAVYTGKAIVEAESDREVHSVSLTMKVPSVIRLRKYVRILYERITFVSYTKHNVHLRDLFVCQYCGKKCESRKLTVDHVLPESRGGLTNWENCVSACTACNLVKDNRTPQEAKLKLIRQPRKPHGFAEILRIKIGEIHSSWYRYLGITEE